MFNRLSFRFFLLFSLFGLAVGALLWSRIGNGFLYQLLFKMQIAMERSEQLRQAILSYGVWAPAVFGGIQILQVVLAPIPGEASGFLGGYLFGVWPSFLYSSIGLTVGSAIAFYIGRFLGDSAPQAFRDSKTYTRFNHLVSRGGFVIPFLLFVLPGFPKDSLSYILGVSRMPFSVFLFITLVGRMPGTLMLSLQGAEVYQGNWVGLGLLTGISLAVILPCYLFRKQLLAWLSRFNHQDPSPLESKLEKGDE